MTRPPALSADAVAAALAGLPAWSGGPEAIVRSARSTSMSGIAAFAVEIAAVADAMDHHPDVDLRYRTIHVRSTTHDAGGVTELDLRLAREVDRILDGPAGAPTP